MIDEMMGSLYFALAIVKGTFDLLWCRSVFITVFFISTPRQRLFQLVSSVLVVAVQSALFNTAICATAGPGYRDSLAA